MDLKAEGSPSLREVMGVYPTGVTIVAALDHEGEPYGLTVNSFTSVSLDPPLVLVCIAQSSTSHDRLVGGEDFSINVLAAHQAALAARFASEPSHGRFDEVSWEPGAGGVPVLVGAAAALECSIHERVSGGDHTIVLGRVRGSRVGESPALVFHKGRFSSFGP